MKTVFKNKEKTASANEISKFISIAEHWWDPDGPFAPLHKMNRPRLEFILDNLQRHFDLDLKDERPLLGLKVLDIGCGGGLACEPLARLGASVLGIDAGEENITIAKEHSKKSGLNISYQKIAPENLSVQGASFDIILNMEVIEHVNNLDYFLEASKNLMHHNGNMFISTINRTLKSLVLAKIGAEYILGWLPVGTHDWQKFVCPKELSSTLSALELKISNSKGFRYDICKDQWNLNDDLNVNYISFITRFD